MKLNSFLRCLVIVGAATYSLASHSSACLKDGFIEAHNTTQKIIDAFKLKDITSIADLIHEPLDARGPSREYVLSANFDDLFSTDARTTILALEGTDDQCVKFSEGFQLYAWNSGVILTNFLTIRYFENTLPVNTSAPIAVNGYWESSAGNLHPNCFSYEWFSGDNYQHIAEIFNINGWEDYEELRSNPGKFFGASITNFDLIETGSEHHPWFNIGFKTKDCIASKSVMELDQDEGVKIACQYGDCESYKLLRVVSTDTCDSLAPNFSGQCKSAFLVRLNNGHHIFGLFHSNKHGEVIFPLKSFSSLDRAHEFLR
jgi:hypothetical protein